MTQPADKRQLLAVMFTDVVGYSAKMGSDQATTMRVVREHRELVRAAIAEHAGQERQTVGDAFLVVFDSALHAVQCAVAIQERLARRNATQPASECVLLRIGVHLGEVVLGSDGEIYGDAVNIAARVQPKSPIGGLTISETVLHQIRAHGAWAFKDVGTVPLKNIAHPPRLYSLEIGGPPKATKRGVPRWALGALAAAVIVAGLSFAAVRLRPATEVASPIAEAQAAYTGAWDAMKGGDSNEALRLLRIGAERDPKSWRISFARSLLAPGQVEKEEARAQALSLAPPGPEGDPARLYDRAMREIDSPAVAEAWDAWLAANPDDAVGRFAAVLSYPLHGHEGLDVNEGQPHDHGPLKQARAYVEHFPDDMGARVTLAVYEHEGRHRDRASAQLQEVLARCASCAMAHRVAGDLAILDRRWDEAEVSLRSALGLDPTVPLVREQLAHLALFRGDEEERTRRVEALLSDDGPLETKVAFIIAHGDNLLSVGRWRDATALFERGIALAPDDPTASIEPDSATIAQGIFANEPERAARALTRMVQTSLRPEVPSAVRDSVAVLALDVESDLAFLSHDDRRVKEIDERLRALPANRFVEVNRAGVLRNSDAKVRAVQGEVEIAVKSMRTYFPGCIPSRNIALFYERAGRADEAGSAWREVVGDSYCPLPSALVAAHLALGEIALQSGDLATAKAEAAQVRQLWPTPDEDLSFTKRLVALEAAAP